MYSVFIVFKQCYAYPCTHAMLQNQNYYIIHNIFDVTEICTNCHSPAVYTQCVHECVHLYCATVL